MTAVITTKRAQLPKGFDLSDNRNTGTIVSGRALSLDGTGDSLDGGSIAAHVFTGSFTVSLWAKTSSATEQTFAMKFSGGSTGYQVTLRADQNPAYWQCSIADSTGWTHARARETDSGIPAALDDGVWRHITLRGNNGTLEAYVDGVIGGETDTYENTTALGTSAQRFTIGGNYASTPSKLVTGSMCGLKVWNVALSAAQILEQYNNPEQVLPAGASAANLISYWPLHDYDNTSPNSLDGLYFMDLGTAKSNAKASNCGMDRKEGTPCPQLGLMPSLSRRFFDGSNDWYTGGNGIAQSSGLAISAWVIPFNNSGAVILETANDGNSRTGLAIHPTGKAQFQHYAGSGYFGKADDGGVSYEGKLMHIVGCYDGTGWDTDAMKLYVNGSEKTSTAINTAGLNGSDATGVGAGFIAGGSPDKKFLGHIVSIAVWGDDISAAEVTEIYNGGPEFDPLSDSGNYASSGDLSHYWKLNNAYTVQDLKGSKDLTRVGGTEMTVIPEGATPGLTVFGGTEEKRADNAVINLDGHSYVSIPHDVSLNPDMSEGFTVSVWAKMRNLGNGASTPIFDKDTSNDRWYLRIRDDASDAIQFNFGDGSGNSDVGYGNLTDNDWHHYVFVLNTSGSAWTTARMYKDGAHISSADADISARNADTPGTDALTIGSTGTTASFDGAVAYPKIYARSLSENEVKLLYSSGLRVVGGL
tara:strand:- start:362 stop:2458 length:2097 start_codon:yes stop_codon:yes gene_type:complete